MHKLIHHLFEHRLQCKWRHQLVAGLHQDSQHCNHIALARLQIPLDEWIEVLDNELMNPYYTGNDLQHHETMLKTHGVRLTVCKQALCKCLWITQQLHGSKRVFWPSLALPLGFLQRSKEALQLPLLLLLRGQRPLQCSL
jgi:hypothetical protein